MLQTFFAEDLVQANHRIKFTTNEQPLCIQRVFNKLKGVQRLLQTQSFGQMNQQPPAHHPMEATMTQIPN